MPAVWLEYEKGESRVANIVHQVDKFECLHQAFIYQRRHRGNNLSEFRGLRNKITDPWLAKEADMILTEWDAIEQNTGSNTSIIFMIGEQILKTIGYRLTLLGGPGVGKGTQCSRITEEFNYEHISVGDLLREEQNRPDSIFCDFIRDSFRDSVIIPPDLSMLLLKDRIQTIRSQNKGVLIDGFPRSVGQAQAFEQWVS